MLNIDPYTVLRENHKLKNTVSGLSNVVQEQADIIIKLKLRLSDMESSLKRKKEEQRCLRGERMRLCTQLFRLQVALLGLNKAPEVMEKGAAELLSLKGKRLQELLQLTTVPTSPINGRSIDTDGESAGDGVSSLKLKVAKVALAAERLLREIDGAVASYRHSEQDASSRNLVDLKKVNKQKLHKLLNNGQPCDIVISPLLAGMLDAPAVTAERLVDTVEHLDRLGTTPDFSKAIGILFLASRGHRAVRDFAHSANVKRSSVDDEKDELIWEAEELTRRKKNYHVEYTSLLTVHASYVDTDTQTDEKSVEHRAVGDDAEEPVAPAESEEEAKRDEGIANLEAMGQNLFGGLDVQQVLDGHEEEDADTCFGKSDIKVFNIPTSTASDEQIEQFTKICMSLRTDRQSMDTRLQELHSKIHQRRKAAVDSIKELESCLFKLEDFALDRMNEATTTGEMNAKDAEIEKNKLRHLTQNAHTALHAMRQSMHRYSGQLELYGSMQQEAKVSAAVDIMLVYLKMLKDEHDQKDRELQKIRKELQESISGTIIRRRMNKVRPIEITVDGNVVQLDTQLKLQSMSTSMSEASSATDAEHFLDGPNLELRDVQLECNISANRDYLDALFEVATARFPRLEAYLTVDEAAIDHILDEDERVAQLRKLTRTRKVRVAQGVMLFFVSIAVLITVLLI